MRLRALVLIGAVLGASTVAAARPARHGTTVLARTGDVASDGLAIDAISSPVASRASDVAFVGSTSAILVHQGSTTAAIAKTGDALPGGLGGRFNAVYDPSVNDAGTTVVFVATLNGNAPAGLFRYEGGGLAPVLVGDLPLGNPAVNDAGDILFEEGDELLLRARGTSDDVRVVSLDDPVLATNRRSRFFGRPVLNAAGAVAFAVDGRRGPGGGAFFWNAASGVVPIGRVGDPSPLVGQRFAFTRRQAVAINVTGQVAFTATLGPSDSTAVFVYDPGTGATRTIVAAGDVISGAQLTDIDPEYVGIDASGRVVFEGRFEGARRLVLAAGTSFTTLGPLDSAASDFHPGLTGGARAVWVHLGNVEGYDAGFRTVLVPGSVPLGGGFTLSHPTTSDGGVTVALASRSGLYRVQNGGLRLVTRDGDIVAGSGALGNIVDGNLVHAFRDDTLVVLATDVAGNRTVAIDGSRGLTKIVATGDPAPDGGLFSPSSSLAAVDVARRTVLFSSPIVLPGGAESSGLFQLKLGARPIRTLVHAGDAAPGGGAITDLSLQFGGRTPVFIATLDDGRTGLFTLRGRRPSLIARSGDTAPGGGIFGEFQLLASDGVHLVFTARLGTAADAPVGLFRHAGSRVKRLAAAGDPVPVGGVVTGFLAIDANGVFGATILQGTTARTGLFRRRGRGLQTIALAGDSLGGGATLSLDGVGAVTSDGPRVGFFGGQSEITGIRTGLFEVQRRRLRTVALAGDATPLGGTYAFFDTASVAPADDAVVFAAAIDGSAEARAGLFAAR